MRRSSAPTGKPTRSAARPSRDSDKPPAKRSATRPARDDAKPAPKRRAAPPKGKPAAKAKPAAPKTIIRRATKPGGAHPPEPYRPGRATKQAVVAGPEAAPRARKRQKPVTPDRLELIVAAAQQSLEDDKAEEIVVLDVTGRSDFTDRMIIATGQVERQLQAMAAHVEDALEKQGMKLRRSDIQASPDWVLIDCGDLVIHLFRPEARQSYALERMWGPESPAPEG